MLQAREDDYGGVIVNTEALPHNPAEFESLLTHSIASWRVAKKRGVWLKMPPSHAHLISACVREGFEFHHAEKDYLMLTNWLPAAYGEESPLPPNASHQVVQHK